MQGKYEIMLIDVPVAHNGTVPPFQMSPCIVVVRKPPAGVGQQTGSYIFFEPSPALSRPVESFGHIITDTLSKGYHFYELVGKVHTPYLIKGKITRYLSAGTNNPLVMELL